MNWLEALKVWNARRGGKYTIPKKGTPEYEEVRSIMSGASTSTENSASTVPVAKKPKRKNMKMKGGQNKNLWDDIMSMYSNRVTLSRAPKETFGDVLAHTFALAPTILKAV